MPQEKKFYSEEQVEEIERKAFAAARSDHGYNDYCEYAEATQLPSPALTIPEAEVDANKKIRKKFGIVTSQYIDSGGDIHIDQIEELMHEYSDLRLAKAMEESMKITDVAELLRWYSKLPARSKCTVHPPPGSGDSHGIFEIPEEELIRKFLAEKKKGEGNV